MKKVRVHNCDKARYALRLDTIDSLVLLKLSMSYPFHIALRLLHSPPPFDDIINSLLAIKAIRETAELKNHFWLPKIANEIKVENITSLSSSHRRYRSNETTINDALPSNSRHHPSGNTPTLTRTFSWILKHTPFT